MTKEQLDEELSKIQHALRDGYHDHLSEAVANFRNRYTLGNMTVRCTPRFTYTYVTMDVSGLTYDEIAKKLRAAGYDHVFHEGLIDMHGLALKKEDE